MKNLRQRYYDLFSKVYDRFISLHSRVPQGVLKKYLAALAPMEDGGRVLDVCCGTGSLLVELSQRTGVRGLAVGLDFSMGMLKVNRGKRARTQISALFRPTQRPCLSTRTASMQSPAPTPFMN